MDQTETKAVPGSQVAVDEGAFVRLVKEHQARIGRYLYRIVGQVEDAQDLTQEVFLRAYDRWRDLRSYDSAASWLFAIAANLARNYHRRRRLRSFVPLQEKTAKGLVGDPPDEAVVGEELVGQVLSWLPNDAVQCLLLHDAEGFTASEVAKILGIKPDAARQRIARARRQFRQAYGVLVEKDGK